MTLRDQAITDLATMHNVDEFATPISFNGAAAVPCILDEELARTAADGVREWDVTLYVRASDLAEPVIDQHFALVGDDIGERSAIVVHTSTVHGERELRLRWLDS